MPDVLAGWHSLPEAVRSFLVSGLPAWIAAFAAVATLAVVWSRKTSSTVSFDVDNWRAVYRGGELEIAGPIHIAPVGASFIITDISAKARVGRGHYLPMTAVNQSDVVHRGMQGAQQIRLTYLLKHLNREPAKSDNAGLDVRLRLSDGGKARLKRKLAIQKY